MMMDTTEEKRAFLASPELSFDPMYQPGMDEVYHHFMQPKWDRARLTWPVLHPERKPMEVHP
jgi:hypothetical protein